MKVAGGSVSSSPFEIDHVFIAVGSGAPEVDVLRAAGFEEGPGNVHHGQGTACRRVFFDNIYLELIWLVDREEASAPAIERTNLAARAGREEGVSRLGVALRPLRPRGSAREALPVRTWSYRPPYLPAGTAFPVACNSTVAAEPLLFFLPWERRWSAPRLPHPNGARTVTAVSITVRRGRPPTRELRWLQEWDGVRIDHGSSELLTLELDGGVRGQSLKLGPAAPLEVTW